MTFDLTIVAAHFRKCLQPNGDVNLQEYISAYRELNKMFALLGRLFSFVESDVRDKEEILAKYCKDDPAHYTMIGLMLDYEIGKNMQKKTDHPPSGARTLLRLHRALAYVLKLLHDMNHADDHAKSSHIARAAYDDTLAKHHPWMIRQAVHLAVHTLPNVKSLIHDLSGGRDGQEAHKIMEEVGVIGDQVYNAVQKMMANKNCLDLP